MVFFFFFVIVTLSIFFCSWFLIKKKGDSFFVCAFINCTPLDSFQLMRRWATHTWHLSMTSMRNLFAPDLSVLTLSNHHSLKKTSRNSSGENLWSSILFHQSTEILYLCCICLVDYLMTNIHFMITTWQVAADTRYETYWRYWDSLNLL